MRGDLGISWARKLVTDFFTVPIDVKFNGISASKVVFLVPDSEFSNLGVYIVSSLDGSLLNQWKIRRGITGGNLIASKTRVLYDSTGMLYIAIPEDFNIDLMKFIDTRGQDGYEWSVNW